MRKCSLYLSLVACIIFSQAALGESIQFSTGGDNDTSWTITVSGGAAVLSFTNNEIDTSNPSPDAVLDDLIDLPDMTLTNLQTTSIGGLDLITATLVPDNSPLTIKADVASGPAAADQTVMSADLVEGGYLTVGTNFIAYSNAQDDLNNVTHVAGYSDVIDMFAAADAAGFDVDFSFSGDTAVALFDLLDVLADGSVSGTLSGQIVAVPEPGMIVLLGLGAGVFLLRRKHRA